jgi:hypothetical protein
VLVEELGAAENISLATTSSTGGGVGVPGDGEDPPRIALNENVSTQTNDVLHVGARDDHGNRTLSADISGQRDEQLTIAGNGHTLASSNDSAQVSGHVDEHGQSTVRTSTQEQSDLDALPQSLRDALHTHWEQVQDLNFGRGQLAQLVAMAENSERWSAVLPPYLLAHQTLMSAWSQLRSALLHPPVDARAAQINAAVAAEIGRVQALRDFRNAAGAEDGRDALLAAMRGEGRHMGERLEFENQQQEHEFNTIRDSLDGAAERWESLDAEHIRQDALGLRVRIEILLALVRAREVPEGDETMADAMAETVDTILNERQRLDELQASALASANGHSAAAHEGGAPHPAQTAHANSSAHDGAAHEGAAAPSLAPAGSPAHAEATAAVAASGAPPFDTSRFTTELGYMKDREHQLWVRAQEKIAHSRRIFTLSSTSEDINAALEALDQIAATYPRWVQLLNTAVEQFRQHNADIGKLHDLHPNPEWSIVLMQQAIDAGGDDPAANEIRSHAHERQTAWREAVSHQPQT